MSDPEPFERGKQALDLRDYKSALGFLQPLAEAGHPEAQRLIGDLYLRGHGIDQDVAQALSWYQEASDQGNPLASEALAFLYDPFQNHPDLPLDEIGPDEAVAREYYKKAFLAYFCLAEKGDRDAHHNLATYYFIGLGEPADKEKAFFWYTRAAENGNPYSCAQLGYLHFDRNSKSNEVARKWYQMGIRLGRKVFHIPELEEENQ